MKKSIKTPVVITIWNRKDIIQRVFNVIKKVKPPVIYAITDGGRNPKEQAEIDKACKVLGQVNWKCKVIKDFAKINEGPKKRLGEGFSSFFDLYETGIFLEHDCLPDPSFFYYCEKLLKRYKNNKRVMHISGNNFQNDIKRGDGSYYFSSIPSIWGFATWRRAWKHYDYELKDFDHDKCKKQLTKTFSNRMATKYWLDIFRKTVSGDIDTWDYQWTYALIMNNGLCINPQKNLVKNIGFYTGAANTTDENHPFAKLPLNSLGSLKHPKRIARNDQADKLILKQNFGIDFYHLYLKSLINRVYGLWLLLVNKKKYKKIKFS